MARKILFSLILLSALLGAASLLAEVVDGIIVVVNTEVITDREVDRILEPMVQQYRSLYYGDELVKKLTEARKKVIDQLIEDRLILSEAKRISLQVDERDVETRMEEVKKRFKSKDEFERALAQQNISVKELRRNYREQIMVRKLVDAKVGSKIVISPVEVEDFYKKHSGDFMQPELLRLRTILIRPRGNEDMRQALGRSREVLIRLKQGCDFAGLAKEYSDGPNASEGGLMGYVKKGDLLPAIENAVFKLKDGEISGIVQTSVGYHIFKVEDRQPPKVLQLSEIKREVEEALFKDKVREKIRGWIETLKKNAYIAYK